MDNTFEIWRVSDDQTIVRCWVFADVFIAGQLVLERYTEYHVKEWRHSGDHAYDLVYDGIAAKGGIKRDMKMPRDVIERAAQIARWYAH